MIRHVCFWEEYYTGLMEADLICRVKYSQRSNNNLRRLLTIIVLFHNKQKTVYSPKMINIPILYPYTGQKHSIPSIKILKGNTGVLSITHNLYTSCKKISTFTYADSLPPDHLHTRSIFLSTVPIISSSAIDTQNK